MTRSGPCDRVVGGPFAQAKCRAIPSFHSSIPALLNLGVIRSHIIYRLRSVCFVGLRLARLPLGSPATSDNYDDDLCASSEAPARSKNRKWLCPGRFGDVAELMDCNVDRHSEVVPSLAEP